MFHKKKTGHEVIEENEQDSGELEKAKIRSAITTDFILSIEIVIIALGAIADADLTIQVLTVCVVALIATVGVYGTVALIVRMDDVGYGLIKKSDSRGFMNSLGELLVKALPIVIKALSFVGTIALILVSGGIFVHNLDFFHDFLPTVPSILKEAAVGLVVGSLVVGIVTVVKKMFFKEKV